MAKMPYRDPVQALNDVAEGRLHFYWSALCHRAGRRSQAGRVKLMAITSSEPSTIAAGRADHRAGRLPGTDVRRSGRHLRHARHAGRAARAHRGRRRGRRSPIRRSSARLIATGQEVVPGSRRVCRRDRPAAHGGGRDRQGAGHQGGDAIAASRRNWTGLPASLTRPPNGFPLCGATVPIRPWTIGTVRSTARPADGQDASTSSTART